MRALTLQICKHAQNLCLYVAMSFRRAQTWGRVGLACLPSSPEVCSEVCLGALFGMKAEVCLDKSLWTNFLSAKTLSGIVR